MGMLFDGKGEVGGEMSDQGLADALQKMRRAGVGDAAADVFASYYRQLESGATGLIAEDSIEPLTNPPLLSDVVVTPEQAKDAIQQSVMIKLNGGLGTSMGLDKAKSLLEVRAGKTFLDLIVAQVRAARKRYDARLPLLLMNSFRTREDSLAALEAYPDLPVDGLPLDFIQNLEPKLLADDLSPVEWPADPSLEWCPPGHGDLYTSLLGTGILKQLIDKGFRYASVSNCDNLGAGPNGMIAGWFASSGAPYAAELCRRTINDKKGGHLAIRKADRQLILRDTAQTAPSEMDFFTDEYRHPYFHTNNLWFDLIALNDLLTQRNGVLGLPLIRNEKTVDPTDPNSPKVIQIESAMGSAIETFEGATAICVGRDRFQPVKTTNELLLLRSDAYDLNEDGSLLATTTRSPEIALSKYYKTVQGLEARIPVTPSLKEAEALIIDGDWSFGNNVVVRGRVHLEDLGAPGEIADGTFLEG